MSTRDKNDFLALLSGVRQVFAESQEYEATLSAIAHSCFPTWEAGALSTCVKRMGPCAGLP